MSRRARRPGCPVLRHDLHRDAQKARAAFRGLLGLDSPLSPRRLLGGLLPLPLFRASPKHRELDGLGAHGDTPLGSSSPSCRSPGERVTRRDHQGGERKVHAGIMHADESLTLAEG